VKLWKLWSITLVMLVLVISIPTHAQEEISAATVGENEAITLENLPERVMLSGTEMIWQDISRCSAAALTIQLSYWRDDYNYWETISYLNHREEDVSVRLDEMIVYAETFGLKGIERMGGTLDMLKLLIANGFPVLIENSYYDSNSIDDWMSHNRVIIGYDNTLGVLYSFDSLRGNDDGAGIQFEYTFVEERWRSLNNAYMVLYEPEDEQFLQAIMGDQWDTTANAEWSLQMAQAELDNQQSDSFSLFNKGTALVTLGRYQEAAEAYDRAREIGLPWRMMWYQFGPLEAYLQVGRTEDVYQIVRNVITNAPGVEEMYYYIARAYLGDGNTERAIANLEATLWRNPNYSAAQELLDELCATATCQ
jgi:tetratricopeptide (TPR) repeat protein